VAPEWLLQPGERIRRVELHKQFGGREQGGIGPSAKSPNVFVFTDPSGERHGYYDGWLDGCFHYTGEGQRGDQVMNQGNAAILNHVADGRALRLFQGARGVVEYLDEFEIDSAQPCYRTDAPETNRGPRREVIIFRLWPKTIEPGDPNPKLEEIFNDPSSVRIPIEQLLTEKFFVSPRGDVYEADRREQALVLEFEAYLKSLGHQIWRHKFRPSKEGRPILTDLFDGTTGTLIEAKGTVERNAIRMAIGQLADYRRFIESDELHHLAVLVPREPREDLCDLLGSQGIEYIYPVEGGFSDSTGGALVDS
jgi:hypothetical protein